MPIVYLQTLKVAPFADMAWFYVNFIDLEPKEIAPIHEWNQWNYKSSHACKSLARLLIHSWVGHGVKIEIWFRFRMIGFDTYHQCRVMMKKSMLKLWCPIDSIGCIRIWFRLLNVDFTCGVIMQNQCWSFNTLLDSIIKLHKKMTIEA